MDFNLNFDIDFAIEAYASSEKRIFFDLEKKL